MKRKLHSLHLSVFLIILSLIIVSNKNGYTNCNLEAIPILIQAESSSGAFDGIISVDVLNGSGNYSYLWNTLSTNDTLYNLNAGTYSVTITDNLEDTCEVSASIELTLENPDTILVWPGDANNDGIVNNLDLFNIGIGFSTSHIPRDSITNSWQAQTSIPWPQTFGNGLNYAFANCNGDSIINELDTLAIVNNYNLTHFKNDESSETENGAPLSFITTTDTIEAGSTFYADIYLGNSLDSMEEIYGIATRILFDPNVVEQITFSTNNNWLGTPNQNLLTIQKKFVEDGELHIAMVRTDQNNIGGYGSIGTVGIVTSDNISGKDLETLFSSSLQFGYTKAITFNQEEIDIQTSNKEFIIDTEPSSINTSSESSSANIFPCPFHNQINIYNDKEIFTLSMYDLNGKIILTQSNIHNNKTQLRFDNSFLLPGLYILEIIDSIGTHKHKISKMY